MPARKLSDIPVAVAQYDVLVLAPVFDDLPLHVMLFNEKGSRNDVTDGTELDIVHMGPPLGELRRKQCFAVGSADLNEGERSKIAAFVKERIAERDELRALAKAAGENWDSRVQYRIHPAATPPSRTCNYWRFSCVGFVLTAYKYARILLLSEQLPEKDLEQIKVMYSDPRLSDPDFCDYMGISPAGSKWPVAVVGYILNALNRTTEQIRANPSLPFEALEGDEYFPSRRGNATTVEAVPAPLFDGEAGSKRKSPNPSL